MNPSLQNPFEPSKRPKHDDATMIGELLGEEAEAEMRKSFGEVQGTTRPPEDDFRDDIELTPEELLSSSEVELKKLLAGLNPAIEEFQVFINNGGGYATIESEDDMMKEFIPKIHLVTFKNHEFALQKILKFVVDGLVGIDAKQNSGYLLSIIYNRQLDDATSRELEEITQIIKVDLLTGYIDGLGYKLPGSTLVIRGEAGDGVGEYMTGGKILADIAGDFCGYEFSGGLIKLEKAGADLGKGMTGGRMEVEEAGDDIGSGKTGGEIYVGGELVA